MARIDVILARMKVILASFGNLESNIPVDPRNPHEYWQLKAELHGIRAPSS